jgi:polar amino acid transport system permease protein
VALTRRQRARLTRWSVYAATLALLAWIVVTADWGRLKDAFFDTEIFWHQFPEILTRAARNTLTYTALAFVLASAWALVLALMRLSPLRPYRWFATAYIELFRGLPALITLLAVGYAIPIALDFRIPGTFGPGAVGLAIVYSAYIAETIRGGIEAVPRGQVEAARSLGMSAPTTMVSIVLPQAFRTMVPPLTNELVALIKDTSLLALVLGATSRNEEITKFARDEVSRTFNITPLVAAGVAYLIVTIPLTQFAGALERRNRRAR